MAEKSGLSVDELRVRWPRPTDLCSVSFRLAWLTKLCEFRYGLMSTVGAGVQLFNMIIIRRCILARCSIDDAFFKIIIPITAVTRWSVDKLYGLNVNIDFFKY